MREPCPGVLKLLRTLAGCSHSTAFGLPPGCLWSALVAAERAKFVSVEQGDPGEPMIRITSAGYRRLERMRQAKRRRVRAGTVI